MDQRGLSEVKDSISLAIEWFLFDIYSAAFVERTGEKGALNEAFLGRKSSVKLDTLIDRLFTRCRILCR